MTHSHGDAAVQPGEGLAQVAINRVGRRRGDEPSLLLLRHECRVRACHTELVPGGRWLVTGAQGVRSSIRLYPPSISPVDV